MDRGSWGNPIKSNGNDSWNGIVSSSSAKEKSKKHTSPSAKSWNTVSCGEDIKIGRLVLLYRQWEKVKAEFSDSVIIIRDSDKKYYTFRTDAATVSKAIGVKIKGKGNINISKILAYIELTQQDYDYLGSYLYNNGASLYLATVK